MVVSFLLGALAGGFAVSLSQDTRHSVNSSTEGLRIRAADQVDQFADVIEAWLEAAKTQTAGRLRALANSLRRSPPIPRSGSTASPTRSAGGAPVK
jgi:hypothetical protein